VAPQFEKDDWHSSSRDRRQNKDIQNLQFRVDDFKNDVAHETVVPMAG